MDSIYAKVGDGLKHKSSPERKLQWLRSQIIGRSAEFDSPFGRRRVTYADTTASGQSLLYIENYILHHLLPFYGNTHTTDSYVGMQTTKMVNEATHYMKRCLGGGEEDAILFCGSGTTAAIKRLQEVMGITVPPTLRDRVVQTILKDEEHWLVFVGPHEHHSNLLSWRNSLAEVVEIGMTHDGLVDLEELRDHLEGYKDTNRPMMGSFSASSNVTGIYLDTRAIATLLHQYGAFACFDFASSGPHAKINMKSGETDGYDAIFLSPHKFLGGPGSPGILLMNKALYQLGSTCPSTCGGGIVRYVNGVSEEDTLYNEDVEERENAGTPPITQTIRASLAFWVKEYIGHLAIENREQNYIQAALERLVKNENIEILGNTRVQRQAILSFLVFPNRRNREITDDKSQTQFQAQQLMKPLHGPFVAKLLNDLFGIQARGGCSCAGPYAHILLNIDKQSAFNVRSYVQKGYLGVKPGWTRVSFPFYLSNEEFEFILDAIEFVANYGQMFLPLYHLNFINGNWSFKLDPWVSEVLQTFYKFNKHNGGRSSNNNNNNSNSNSNSNSNNNKSRQDSPKVTQYFSDWVSNSFKEIKLKGSKLITGTRNGTSVNNQIRNGDQGEVTQSREYYKEVAMYLASIFPLTPKQDKFPKELDTELLFIV